jgi:hypothetical protein
MKHWIKLLLMSAALSGAPAQAQTQYTGDGVPLSIDEEIRWRVNRGRFDSASENHLRGTTYSDIPATSGPLAPNQAICTAAQHHSTDMATFGIFQHATITGSAYYDPVTQPNPWDRMTAEGYSWNTAGENIAAGYVGAEDVYLGWWNSEGHRVNMYDSDFREIGNGYAVGSTSYRYWYTMDLGSSGSTCFFTDTLFRDANGNNVYDAGEGVSNVVVSLVCGTNMQSYYDISTTMGSFAVPITSISGGSNVQVVLSNASATTIVLTIPRNYTNFTQVPLTAGERKVYGVFAKPATPQNVGFRQLTLSPRLTVATNSSGATLTWASTKGITYEVQWSTNLPAWNKLTHYTAGTNNAMVVDTVAPPNPGRLYRLVIR